MFYRDRRTDRHDKDNSSFWQFANAPKKGFLSIHGLQSSRARNIRLQMNDHSTCMWFYAKPEPQAHETKPK